MPPWMRISYKACFFFNDAKKKKEAFYSCLDVYFHASIIKFFLICLESVQKLGKGTL